MRLLTISCCFAVLAGCSKPDEPAAQDSTDATLGASISLATVAGTWNMRTMAAASDSVLVSFQMVATDNVSGWANHFANRPPVPLRVLAVEGDSIVTESGPYESVLRQGVQVSTHSVLRLRDGVLVGNTVARYSSTGADSVVMLRTEGTRAP